MKCPHCHESISLFSGELNRFGKTKTCPHCQKSIRLFLSFKVAALLFVPAVALNLLFIAPVFARLGLARALATALTCGVVVMLAMRLKETKSA